MNKTRASRYTYLPIISYQKAQESYFIFDGSVYSVANCTSEVFRAAVKDARNRWNDNVVENLLSREEIDLVTRWFILNELCRVNNPIKLYPSEEKAESAFKRLANLAVSQSHD